MNVTFRQLRLFLALADSGSVGGAARLMHVTQPTASMQLREITEAVGVPLYEVISRKVHLTDAGRDLARTARGMVQLWEDFEQGVGESKALRKGRLRIAVVSTAKYFMPRLVGEFCAAHPAIDLSLEILNRDGVVQRLKDNLDDLYIMSTPPRMELDDTIFLANPLVIIVSARSPLLRGRRPRLAALSDQRFVLRERGSGTRMTVDQHFRLKGFRPDVRMELGSNEAIKEAVAGGLGIGVVSLHALHGRDKEHGVAVLDVEGFPVSSNWHIVHPARKRLSPIAEAFKSHLLREAGSLGRARRVAA